MGLVLYGSSILPWWAQLSIALLSIVSLIVVRREFGRGMAAVAVIGTLLMGPCLLRVRAAEDDGVVVYSDCKGLTPLDWQYWVRDCWAR